MSGAGDTAPRVVEDYRGVIQILSDGTIVRSDPAVLRPPECFPDVPGIQWEDVVYDAAHGLKLRVYRSAAAGGDAGKLPVLVYFHSGGFCLGTFAQPNFHSGCLRLASELPAVVLSADYRLGPEHRLPAAMDDAAAALSWLRGQAASALGSGVPHPWLAKSADFTRVFVAGESSGANMSHHVAVRRGSGQLPLDPLRIAGHVLLTPYFGGAERTAAEAAEPPAGAPFTPEMSDAMWRLSLPAGATRDHPAANPFGPDSPGLEPVAFLPSKNPLRSQSEPSPPPTMSGDTAAPHVVEDLFGVIRLLSDGSVVRGDEAVLMRPEQPFPEVPGVEWKDAVSDASRGLRVRRRRG